MPSRHSASLNVPPSSPRRENRRSPRGDQPDLPMIEQLTYAQIAERLNVSPEAARAIVKRNRLPRSHRNDGRTLAEIDLDILQHNPLPARSPRGQPVSDVVAALNTRIEQIEAELAAEQQRSAGGLRNAPTAWSPARIV